MVLVIKLNSSEALSYFGFFGLVFSLPNFNQIFLEKVFPIIIENSTNFQGLFKISYVLLLLALTYESFNWVIQLIKNMIKTKNLNVDYNYYLLKVVVSGLFGIISALVLNKILF
jgi:hypothetical protein